MFQGTIMKWGRITENDKPLFCEFRYWKKDKYKMNCLCIYIFFVKQLASVNYTELNTQTKQKKKQLLEKA